MKILAIGAHYDDIELSCGGSMLRFKDSGDEIHLAVCTNGDKGGNPEARKQEQEEVNKVMGYKSVRYLEFEDERLEHNISLVDPIDKLIKEIRPDFVFTHHEGDFHNDHIAVAKAVKSANRRSDFSLVVFPSQDYKLPFHANWFVDITDYFDRKLEMVKLFKSQMDRPWLSDDMLRSKATGTGVAKYVERYCIEFMRS